MELKLLESPPSGYKCDQTIPYVNPKRDSK